MMKEYLRKQLRYWVENFRDDMLPRDFGTKSFSRTNVSLHKIGATSSSLYGLFSAMSVQ